MRGTVFRFSIFKQTSEQQSANGNRTKSRFRISETWRKHATPCFRYVYVKVVRFRCIRSNGNARKRHETGNGNTGYPSCFRNGLTCFCHVSVYGFFQFRPVYNCKTYFTLRSVSSNFRRLLQGVLLVNTKGLYLLAIVGSYYVKNILS